MQNNNWREYADNYKPLVDTGRKPLPLEKYPKSLDFSTTIGGTSYTVKSHFNPQANESLLCIILRWVENNTNISE
jgi:hypothetical protein